jgi:putative ABC transport system permease protein
MLNNYTRTAWRSLLKNRSFTVINILGLAAGIAAFLFITTYVRFERSYESFNPNADNVWRITLDMYNGSEYVATDCETHQGMGPILKSRFPEVIDFVRMFNNDGLSEIRIEDKKFWDGGSCFADRSVYEILGVNLIRGDENKSLSEPFQVILAESTAKKYFGTPDALGKSMMINGDMYNVTGVFADQKPNTHFKFTVLMSHETLYKTREWYQTDEWNGNNEFTYLLMRPGTDLVEFNRKLSALCVELKDKLSTNRYTAEPIKTIHLYSHKTFEPETNGDAKVVNFLAIVALFIIVIAWVNYMNLSTARAVERAREVGIRKVMGSLKSQLVIQFLAESLIVNMIAGFIALAFVQMMMPLFEQLTGLPKISLDAYLYLLLCGLVAVGTILAGIYPAFVLSSFSPVAVLKGKFQSSGHGRLLRKGLVTLQFATTIILIIGVSTVYMQVNHLRSLDIGIDLDQTVAVRLPQVNVSDSLFESRYSVFKTEALSDPSVKSITVSDGVPGLDVNELNTSRFTLQGHDNDGRYNYYWYFVDEDFAETLGLQFTEGRDFESKSDAGNVLINETTARLLGFARPEDALGAQISFHDWRTNKPAVVIGVFKNFYQLSPKDEHVPMILMYRDRGSFATAHLNSNDIKTSVDRLKETWDRVFPGEAFAYFFVDENFDQQYRSDIQFGQVMGTFSILAVIIACLGLFGLSSYTILQRRKEIGIRKVLGATIAQVVTLLSGSYLKIILISSLVALPIAWYAIDNWLSGYTVRINMTAWMFVVPIVLILATALITVSFQTIRSALINPARSLKEE